MELTDEEAAAFEAATTEDEWNALCDCVKQKRDGQYPPDWWARIMGGGVMKRFHARSRAA